MSLLPICDLQEFYKGFSIRKGVGNNAFSFLERKSREIHVAPLVPGHLEDLAVGNEIVFSEIENGKEVNKCGLKSFLYLHKDGKDIFIFDNHNHAFFFWFAGLKAGRINLKQVLVHVDQHRDMREPQSWLEWKPEDDIDLQKIFDYTNHELNVGNFIPPALKLGLFSQVEFIDRKDAFAKDLPKGFVLDIDCDIFAPQMNYIDLEYKLDRIRDYIKNAAFITISTSPYFMDQAKAVEVIQQLLKA